MSPDILLCECYLIVCLFKVRSNCILVCRAGPKVWDVHNGPILIAQLFLNINK